jgi:hypothetical protein
VLQAVAETPKVTTAAPVPAVPQAAAPAPAKAEVMAKAEPTSKPRRDRSAERARSAPVAKVNRSSHRASDKEEVILEYTPARKRPATAGSDGQGRTEAAAARAPESAVASLTSYRIVSIYPRSGEFQQAWLRAPSGRMVVVGVGDELDGARVQAVDFTQHVVKTSQGQIR